MSAVVRWLLSRSLPLFLQLLRSEFQVAHRAPDAVFLVAARRLGLAADIEKNAWARFRSFRLAGFGDSVAAEMLVRGVAISSSLREFMHHIHAYKALAPTEVAALYDTVEVAERSELGRNRQVPLGLLARGNTGIQNDGHTRGGEGLCLHGTAIYMVAEIASPVTGPRLYGNCAEKAGLCTAYLPFRLL